MVVVVLVMLVMIADSWEQWDFGRQIILGKGA